MTFKEFASYLSELDKTSLRNKMTEILADLFCQAKSAEIGKMCYLLQGRVAPLYTAVEFGMADRMMIRAIAKAMDVEPSAVISEFRGQGDLGSAIEKIKNQRLKMKTKNQKLKVTQVYDVLYRIAVSGGEGSQDKKIQILGDLLKEADPMSAKYIVRILLSKLRLGFSDMTILDALSWMMTQSKKLRGEIERAYNVRPDLSFIATTIKKMGIKGVEYVIPVVGTPDIVDGIKRQIKDDKAILEGEAIAYNPKTGEFLPFQETVQRKRKYDIEEMAKKVPLRLFAFDLLFLNGKSLLKEGYIERRKRLSEIVKKGETIMISEEKIVDSAERLEAIFAEEVKRGLEGIMAKRLDGEYQAGARNFNWIKFKKSYESKLTDTIDSVVMGYDLGQGKRNKFGIGDFLIGIYDNKKDKFVTIAKIGTGLTDLEWKQLEVKSQKTKVKSKPKNYDVDQMMECDVWVTPSMVVEIRADEITRSPVHTAGRLMGASKSGSSQMVVGAGYALRFPRLERFRDDKKPTDATTISEIEEMYKLQGKKGIENI